MHNGDRCVWLLIDGSGVGDHDFLVLINMYSASANFSVSEAAPNHEWKLIIDTATWAEPNYNFWTLSQAPTIEKDYNVHGFSIVVLEEVPII